MSFCRALEDNGSCFIGDENVYLLAYQRQTVQCIHAANDWFGARTAEEDERAIQAILKKSLPPSGVFVVDMTATMNVRQGGAVSAKTP
jgi:hypothetical protein